MPKKTDIENEQNVIFINIDIEEKKVNFEMPDEVLHHFGRTKILKSTQDNDELNYDELCTLFSSSFDEILSRYEKERKRKIISNRAKEKRKEDK